MKKALLLVAGLFIMSLAWAQTPAETTEEVKKEGPAISFENRKHDFGDITQGDKVEHIFKFKNTGTAPLVISNVMTTCGCTAPEWPKQPVAAGAEATIKVVFNSRGKMGQQRKVVTIISNAVEQRSTVEITTNVLPPKPSN